MSIPVPLHESCYSNLNVNGYTDAYKKWQVYRLRYMQIDSSKIPGLKYCTPDPSVVHKRLIIYARIKIVDRPMRYIFCLLYRSSKYAKNK